MLPSVLRRSLRSFAAAATLAAVVAMPVTAQVIDFEYADAASDAVLAQGYAGFNWLGGFGTGSWVNGEWSDLSGLYPGLNLNQPVSGKNSVWSNGGTNLTFSKVGGGTFDFNSVWLASAFQGPQTQTVNGYLNTVLVQTSTVNLSGGGMQQFTFDFTGVDAVDFSTQGYNLVVDDITLNSQVVPEPSSFALIGVGLAGLLAVLRRKQQV